MSAAVAGRRARRQDPGGSWKVYDSIFDHQEIISADNAWKKMLGFAVDAGLSQDAFRACLSSPEAAQSVQENPKKGQTLAISSTPTVFVNGRRLLAADSTLVIQYIQFELEDRPSTPPTKPRKPSSQ